MEMDNILKVKLYFYVTRVALPSHSVLTFKEKGEVGWMGKEGFEFLHVELNGV